MPRGISYHDYFWGRHWLRWLVLEYPTVDTDTGEDFRTLAEARMRMDNDVQLFLEQLEHRHYDGIRHIAFENRDDAMLYKLRFGC